MTSKTTQKTTVYVNNVAPESIMMWGGTKPPAGWKICDGTTHTRTDGSSVILPDLRDKFIIGASEAASTTNIPLLHDKGGHHQITLESGNMASDWPKIHDPGHGHDVSVSLGYNDGTQAYYYKETGGTNASTTADCSCKVEETGITIKSKGLGLPFDNRPKYYALYYIQKI